MTVTGLEHTRYYLFNPVWVGIEDAPGRVRIDVKIDGESNFFNLYSYEGKIRFDIGKLILGLVKNVKNKKNLIGNMDGAYRVSLKITQLAEISNPISIDNVKYFLLGGKKGYASNVAAPVDLSLTNYAWAGFPRWKSIFASGIVNSLEPEGDFNVLQPKNNCDNIFLAFRNKLGGFSYYLFEDYHINDNNKNKGYYLTQRDVKIPGVEVESSVTVRGQIHRRFYDTIRSLADSFEIYLWNQNIMDVDDVWVRVNGSNNNVSLNNKNITTDVEMTFDLVSNLNKVW